MSESLPQPNELRSLRAAVSTSVPGAAQRRHEAARVTGVDHHDLPLERMLGQDAGQVLRADLVQRQRIHVHQQVWSSLPWLVR